MSKTLAILNGVITAIALSDEAVMGLGSYGALVVVADSDTNVVGQRYQALDAPVAASAPAPAPVAPPIPEVTSPTPEQIAAAEAIVEAALAPKVS